MLEEALDPDRCLFRGTREDAAECGVTERGFEQVVIAAPTLRGYDDRAKAHGKPDTTWPSARC